MFICVTPAYWLTIPVSQWQKSCAIYLPLLMFLLWWWSSHYGHCRYCQKHGHPPFDIYCVGPGWVVRLSLLSFPFAKFLPFMLFTVSTISSWQWCQYDVGIVCGGGGCVCVCRPTGCLTQHSKRGQEEIFLHSK